MCAQARAAGLIGPTVHAIGGALACAPPTPGAPLGGGSALAAAAVARCLPRLASARLRALRPALSEFVEVLCGAVASRRPPLSVRRSALQALGVLLWRHPRAMAARGCDRTIVALLVRVVGGAGGGGGDGGMHNRVGGAGGGGGDDGGPPLETPRAIVAEYARMRAEMRPPSLLPFASIRTR